MKEKKFYKKLIGSCVLMLCMAVVMIFTVFQADASDEGKTVKYLPNYIYDSSKYINSSTQEKIAPTDEGYLFAGWYTLEGTTYEPVEEPQENAIYYAKFVPEEVLDIKAQVSKTLCDDVATNDGTAAIRFVTSLDESTSYQKVGFKIKKGSTGKEEPADTTPYVYRTLYAVGATDRSGKTEEYKPEELFHSTSYYFKTWTITNIGEKSYNTDVTVTPYWITLDGTRVEGTKSIKTVNLGRSWLYVDTTATDSSELGTYKAPYKSIESAMAYQTELTPQVILKSNVDMTSPIDITKSLTLRGEDGNRSVSEKKTEPSVFTRNTSLTTTTDALLCVKSGNVTFENLTIDGNKNTTANTGRAIAVSTNATLNTKKVTVQNCNANNLMGGAIHLDTNSILNISDSVVQNNATTSEGGAIYLANHAKMNVTNSILQNNEAKAGGAIMTHGEITIEGNSIISQNKTSENGAAIFVHYYGDVIMNNGTISGNVAGTDTKAGNGGAVNLHYNDTLGAGGTMTMSGGTISNNTATGNGGGVCMVQNTSFTMSGGTISGNTAGTDTIAGNGGGVCMAKNTSFTMTGGTISGNTAGTTKKPGNGGGIQMNATGAQVTISNTGVISDNTATGNGGAICNINGSTLTMNGGTISGNTAKGGYGGGAVDVQGAFNMNDGTIEKNSADKNGGAMYIRANGVMTMKGGEISENTSKDDKGGGGGAVDVAAGGTFNMEGGKITGNTAPAGLAVFLSPSNNTTLAKMTMSGGEISGHHKGANNGHGGAIFVHSNAEFAMSGGTIKDNSTGQGDGGAIRLHYNSNAYGSGKHEGSGYMNMSGGTIEQNYAVSGRGGALDIAGEFLMSGGTIQNNEAKANVAGAIYLEASGKMTMSESAKIQNNTSKKEGGAIYHLAGGTLNIQGGIISGNQATDVNLGAGGAILTYGTVTMSGGEISGNTATGNGGAVYLHYNDTLGAGGTMTMSGGTISGNTAGTDTKAGNGGGVCMAKNTSFTMTGGTISGNTAGTDTKAGNGGGIQMNETGAQVTISNTGVISDNTATGNGGAICNLPGSTLTMNGGTISGNTAKGGYGGGAVDVQGIFDMYDGTIEKNSADKNGGAMYIRANGVMTMKGGEISENTSKDDKGGGGGAIGVAAGGIFNLNGGAIKENKAKAGGAVFLFYSKTEHVAVMNMTGGTISNNTTSGDGAGIFVHANAELNMYGGEISGNRASGKAGAICSHINTETYGVGKHGGKAVVSLSGGSVTDNTATGGASNILVKGLLNMSGTVEVDSIYLNSGKTVNLTAALSDRQKITQLELPAYTTRTKVISGEAAIVAEDYVKFAVPEETGVEIDEDGCLVAIPAPSTYEARILQADNTYVNYLTLAKAIAAVPKDGTQTRVEVLKDITLSTFLDIGNGNTNQNVLLTDDGNGPYTISRADTFDSDKLIVVRKNSTLTIAGSSADDENPSLIFDSDLKNGKKVNHSVIKVGASEANKGGTLYFERGIRLSSANNSGVAGVMQINGGTVVMNGGALEGSKTDDNAGAVFIQFGGTFTMKGGSISDNTTAKQGGAIYIKNGSVDIQGGVISNNKAGAEGGAIYSTENGTITLSGGEISGNTAGGNGGAIFLHKNDKGHSSMTMTSGTISNNISNGADGGGAIGVAKGSDFTIKGGTISGNKAAAGGAILTWGTVTMDGGTLSGNTVNGRGGAVFVHVTGTFNMSNGLITENTSDSHGGGVCLHRNKSGAGSMTMSGGSITKNTAGVNGGGIVAISSENKLHISGGSVTGNALKPEGKGVGPEIFAVGTVTSEKTLTIGNTTVDKYVIVASSTENEAAKYLQQQIKNLTGHDLKIKTSSSDENQIIIQSGDNEKSSGLKDLEFKLYLEGTKLYVCAGTAEQEIVAAKMLYTKYMSTDNVENFDTSKNPTISSLNFKFTCDWDAFKTTPSIVQAKSMHLNVEDNHKVLQGGCSDGKYAYYIMNNQTAGVGKEEQWTSYIYKVHLVTGKVQRSEAISLGHANSMTYNPVTNQLVVVLFKPDRTIKYVDADTLELKGVQVFDKPELINIAYNSSTETYALGKRAAEDLWYYEYDGELTERKTTVKFANDITMKGKQDMECYNNKVFWLYSQDKDGGLLNTIYVCKWGGNSILYTIQPELPMEIENIFFYRNVGHTGYVIPGDLGGLVTETIFYQQIQ